MMRFVVLRQRDASSYQQFGRLILDEEGRKILSADEEDRKNVRGLCYRNALWFVSHSYSFLFFDFRRYQ